MLQCRAVVETPRLAMAAGCFLATWFDEKRETNRNFTIQFYLPESAARDGEVTINDVDSGKMVRELFPACRCCDALHR